MRERRHRPCRALEVKRRGEGAIVKEAIMLNRVTVIWLAVALAAALLVVVLVNPQIGPSASLAGLGSNSIWIERMHRNLDHEKLPVHVIPPP